MIELVRTLWLGKVHYSIEHGDGGPRHNDTRRPQPDDVRIAITKAQAALGLDACAALFETARL